MDLTVFTSIVQEGLFFSQQFHHEFKQSNKLDVLGHMNGNIRYRIPFGSRKRNRLVLVFAASEVENYGLNGRAQKFDNSASGHSNTNGNDHFTSVNSSFVLEDVESNNHLRQMVRARELEEGFKFSAEHGLSR